MIAFPTSPGEEGAGWSANLLPRGGRAGWVACSKGSAQRTAAPERSQADKLVLSPFRRERTCDPQGRVRERRSLPKREVERRSVPLVGGGNRFGPDATAVAAEDLLDRGESDAGTRELVGAVKALEQAE